MMTSEELMRSYREDRSEEAFGDLVGRYIDLVYSTALRRLNGDVHLAQDVTQTVFSDLAIKLQSHPPIRMLGGWLHQHTCFASAKVVRTETRRRNLEKEAMNITGNEPDWQEIAPFLDEALSRLEPADQQAVIMRFFERRDFRSLGRELGLSDDAAQKRVARAVDKLRELLVRRGVSISSAVLALALTGSSVQSAPAGLATQVTLSALKSASSVGGMTLLILKIMASTKLKLAIGAALVLVLAVTPLIMRSTSKPSAFDPVANEPSKVSTAKALAQPRGPVPDKAVPSAQLRLTVLDAEDGQPLRSVQIHGSGETLPIEATDRNGQCDIPYAGEQKNLELNLRKELFADTQLKWNSAKGEVIPTEFTVRMAHAARISGQVVGPDDEVVPGATVSFEFFPFIDGNASAMASGPVSHEFYRVETLTDGQGRWEITRIASEMLDHLVGTASHPDYIRATISTVAQSATPEAANQLRDGSHVFRLKAPVTVHGIVVTAGGKPVPDASVMAGESMGGGDCKTNAASDGTFVLKGCPPGTNLLTAEAKGFAASTISVEFKANSQAFKLVLQGRTTLRLKLVNKSGDPIAGAHVYLNTTSHLAPNQPLPQTQFNAVTDQEGRVTWEEAPDKDLLFDCAAAGYMRVDCFPVHPDGKEHLVTMPAALLISGTVHDAVTHQAVPKFRLSLGTASEVPEGDPYLDWNPIARFTLSFTGGVFHHTEEEPIVMGARPNCVFRILAEGYFPYVSRIIKLTEGEAQFDVQLRPAVEKTIKAILPNGSPATGARVGLASVAAPVQITPGGLSRWPSQVAGELLNTDGDGAFRFRLGEGISRIVVSHPDGFAETTPDDVQANPTITLKAWGRVEGVYKPGIPDVAKAAFRLQFGTGHGDELWFEPSAYTAQIDDTGKFVWPKVPPGRFEIVKLGGVAENMMQDLGVYVEVRSDKTSHVTLPGGYTITAHVVSQDTALRPWVWLYTPRPEPSRELLKDKEALRLWYADPEILRQRQNSRYYIMTQTADGSWTTDGVPAGGIYICEANVSEQSDAKLSARPQILFQARVTVTVPATPATGKLDLGEVKLLPVD